MVASLTRAAAAEIAGRKTPIPRKCVGTLHAHAYRALDKPELAETPEGLAAWNEHAKAEGLVWRIGNGAKINLDYAPEQGTKRQGESLLAAMGTLRARRTPRELWPPKVVRFADAWDGWKAKSGRLDFTDLIERALNETTEPPTSPEIMMLDEAQDLSALEFALARKWAESCEQIVVVGDPLQNLFSWRGTDPEAMLAGELASERVLSQSYRVPAAVHEYAMAWVSKMPNYIPIEYKPRLVDPADESKGTAKGEVRRMDATWREPETVVARALADIERGETAMILASCGYMLEPTLAVLKRQGTPFHNPYRLTHGGWNPLRGSRRLLALLRPNLDTWGEEARWYTWEDVRAWAEKVQAKDNFKRGAKDFINSKARDAAGEEDDIPAPPQILMEQMASEELFETIFDIGDDPDPAIRWWESNLLAEASKSARYPLAVYRAHGGAALRERPKLIVGTIHCSPPDEPILTKRGPVPIADLQPEDRLVSYNRTCHRVMGNFDYKSSRGYAFKRSERPYKGDLVQIETLDSKTRVTPNHRVLTKLDEDSFCGRWVVYVMRRGNWWRSGVCVSAHRPYRGGGVNGRLATEQADAGWILSVHETRREALKAEAIVHGKYGIPGLTFQSAKARSLNTEDLHSIHEISADSVAPRAEDCLAAHGLSAEWPLYLRGVDEDGKSKRNLRGWFVTEAANLVPLSGRVCMRVPVQGTEAMTCIATAETEAYEGLVYGLDVPPYHYYVSGGAVVHNSVKGGQADSVYVYPDLSHRGWVTGWERPASRAPTYRLFYVAFTRARERLTICEAAGGEAASLPSPSR